MIRRFAGNAKGTSAVEFALTAPLFIILAFAIGQFGLFLWTQLGLQHAVDLSARCASLMQTTCADTGSIQAYAVSQAYGLNIDSSVFSVSKDACGQNVTAAYTYTIAIPFLPSMPVNIAATSCFPTY
ncbi:pilus assembly protein [Rhizobium sp. CB3090]|uniref:TadE/TadG family type IV pilus assembly protein n=1 Tax=Rhizobium sp. CB3090 TaxID=3039156 RepID=UPI0024B03B98|nr:TadE/TadG family type IV pilus assembly protein [Rhizobium sp. CB3090]WFU10373.1 pilus assembly protein [Rhizobium sp. CB3090]